MNKLFGTDGIRGIADIELNDEFCFRVGKAITKILPKKNGKILIGADTRKSCKRIVKSISSGIESMGFEIVYAGIIPTSAIAYLTKIQKFEAGVMISASHNPHYFNGIKIFDASGYKLSEDEETIIESELFKNEKISFIKELQNKKITLSSYKKLNLEYENFIISTVDCNFKNIKISIDAANGSNFKIAKKIFKKLGAELHVINDKPDGFNINLNCGSTFISSISKFTLEKNADIGISFDGDGDRVLAVDENGKSIDGDKILAILASNFKEYKKLRNNTLVSTVMSNLGLDISMEKLGIKVLKTDVGDKHVLNEMIKKNCNLGGEKSGHIICLDHNCTGDGLLTAVQLVSILKKSGKKTSELSNIISVFPQILINVAVLQAKKYDFLRDFEIKSKIKEIEDELGKNGRILVRASGTEPVIRIMIEGKSEKNIKKHANELEKLITKKFAN